MFMVGLHMALMGQDNEFGKFKEVHICSKKKNSNRTYEVPCAYFSRILRIFLARMLATWGLLRNSIFYP